MAFFRTMFLATALLIGTQGALITPAGHPKVSVQDAEVQTKFEFVGTAEGKIFLLAQDLGYVDYYTAIQTCYEAGYGLALIGSQIQEDVVSNFFKNHEGNVNGFAWIDGSDFVSRGEWYSQRTGQKLDFFNWVSDRPVSGVEGDSRRCIMWKADTFNNGWWDVSCTDTNLAFCELPSAKF